VARHDRLVSWAVGVVIAGAAVWVNVEVFMWWLAPIALAFEVAILTFGMIAWTIARSLCRRCTERSRPSEIPGS
jgi:membrane glycosyltransferase